MGIGTLQATLFYFIIYKIRPHVTVRGGVGFPLCNVLSQGSDRIGSMPDHFTTNSDMAENCASDPELKKVEMMTILGLIYNIYIYMYIHTYIIYHYNLFLLKLQSVCGLFSSGLLIKHATGFFWLSLPSDILPTSKAFSFEPDKGSTSKTLALYFLLASVNIRQRLHSIV